MQHYYSCSINCSCVKLRNQIKLHSSSFISKLYSYDDLPRTRVQTILDDCSDLIKKNINSMSTDLLERLRFLGETPENIGKYEAMINAVGDPFKELNTEWLRFKYFEEKGTYIPPQSMLVGQREDFKSTDTEQELTTVPISVEFIPLRTTLKKILELPNMMDDITNYVNTLGKNPDILENLIEGERWRKKVEFFPGKIVLPLVMYYDGYEPNNPLGSHAAVSNVGAIYVHIPCLPPAIVSKLENIILLMLFHTQDKSHVSFDRILEKAVDEFEFLEKEGIEISYQGKSVRVFFSLAAIIGDNLGVHEVMGFVESFIAKYSCRFCLTKREDINSTFNEASCTLRTPENYKENVNQGEPGNTGVKRACIFNRLNTYDNIEDSVVDPVHDILEGIQRYDLGQTLSHFISVKKYFTLDRLNQRIRGFFYGANEKRNAPRPITPTQLKNKKIIMSAAEMLCFSRNIHLLIGDLVSVDDEHWELLIKMKEICDIITAKVVYRRISDRLKILVSEYLQLLSLLFPNCLKPKHHLLLHYSRMFSKWGPIWHLGTLTDEEKHHPSKVTARVSVSRINICHTLAIKEQLRMNHRLRNEDPSLSLPYSLGTTLPETLESHQDYFHFASILPPHRSANIIGHFSYMGHDIKKGVVLMMPTEAGPQLHVVELVLSDDRELVVFITHKLGEYFFDRHFQSYQIDMNEKTWGMLTYREIKLCSLSYVATSGNGNKYVPKRWV